MSVSPYSSLYSNPREVSNNKWKGAFNSSKGSRIIINAAVKALDIQVIWKKFKLKYLLLLNCALNVKHRNVMFYLILVVLKKDFII